jgi:hypothetical protein
MEKAKVIEGMVYVVGEKREIVSKERSNALTTALDEYRGVQVRVTIETLTPRCAHLNIVPDGWQRCYSPATHVISFSDNPEDCTETCWEHLGEMLSDTKEMRIYRIAGKEETLDDIKARAKKITVPDHYPQTAGKEKDTRTCSPSCACRQIAAAKE